MNASVGEPSTVLPEDSRLLSFSSSSDDTDSTDSNGLKTAKKHPWSPEEDESLRLLVQKYGPRDWGKIAMHLNNRNGKQCHQRWNYFLNPTVRRGDWTQEEDRAILYHQRLHGNKWAKIASYLPGRTGHAVKNRFHQIANHLRRRRCPQTPVVTAEGPKGVHEAPGYAWQVSAETEGVPPPPPGYQYVTLASQGNCMMPLGQDGSIPHTQATAAYLQAVKPSQMGMQSTLLGAGQGQPYYQTPEELFAYQWAATQPQAAVMQAAYSSPHAAYAALLPEIDMMAAQQQAQQAVAAAAAAVSSASSLSSSSSSSHGSSGSGKWK